MRRWKTMRFIAVFLFLSAVLQGCTGGAAEEEAAALRDSTPSVRATRQGTQPLLAAKEAVLDAAYAEDGYVSAKLQLSGTRVKLQITGPDAVTYTYELQTVGQYEVFPLTAGSGDYQIGLYKNIKGTTYAGIGSTKLTVTLKDEFAPFLTPNQYVNFTSDAQTVQTAEKLAQTCKDDLAVVKKVYEYVTQNIAYDSARAEDVKSTYLPDVDQVLSAQKGICFDYAALMTAMLRSQRIPCKLVIGYAGEVYHAWISVYTPETGWIEKIIFFDGKTWTRMDPTFAAGRKDPSVTAFIGDGKNYNEMYVH